MAYALSVRRIAVAVVGVLALAGCGSTTTSKVGAGTSTHPASADVMITSCHNKVLDAALPNSGIATATGTVVNHSSKTSDYTVQIGFFNHAGTRVATGAALEAAVPAAGTLTFSADADQELGDHVSVTCKLVEVTRLATTSGHP